MKKYFAEYHYSIKRWAKRHQMGIDDAVLALLDEADGPDPTETIKQSAAVAEYRILTGEGVHYFVESDELARKLIEFGITFDPRILEIIAENYPRGIIHTCGKQATAVMFDWHPGILILCENGTLFHSYPVKEKTSLEPGCDRAVRLVLGFALYAACFPDAVKDGFPEFAKHPNHFRKSRCSAVFVAPQIVDRSGPIPHFRHGHPRILQSERYTRMRWKVIWVSECFVKGQVRTVEENGQDPCNS